MVSQKNSMNLARQIVDFAIKAGSSDIHLEEGRLSLFGSTLTFGFLKISLAQTT